MHINQYLKYFFLFYLYQFSNIYMGQTTTFQTAGAEFFQGLDAFLLSNWNQFSLTDVLLHSPIFRKLR